MARNLKITVDGRTYAVTVEDVASPAETLYPTPGMRSEVLEPSIAEPAAPVPEAASAQQPLVAGAGDVTSPMTGVLLEYTVKVGDAVAANQQVATIEAMKMKTIVVSQVAGKVLKLAVEPGSSVDSGQVLLTIG